MGSDSYQTAGLSSNGLFFFHKLWDTIVNTIILCILTKILNNLLPSCRLLTISIATLIISGIFSLGEWQRTNFMLYNNFQVVITF